MSASAAKTEGLALLAGVVAGYLAYQRASAAAAPAGPCAGLPPAATQTLAENLSNFVANAGEDVVLDGLAAFDLAQKAISGGYIQPDLAAQFYSWWHGLTPEQQQAVTFTEDHHLSCAAAETVQQVGAGGAGLATALLTGGAVYLVVTALESDE